MEGAMIAPPSIIMVCDLPAWPCGCPLLAEAIAAVNRAVATWLKRDRGILATFCADHGMHLTWALAVAITALVTSCLTARITALGLVGETLHRMERLIVCAEGERLPTVHTCECFVLVVHR